ncbi:MAG TPA: organoarsenical effux MFS transporter ArsJ, partial [Rhodobacterales bacterium]|nr:organoarsenical effux MFS transporter ArsJ [Rhodobacterales bacterium]
MAETNTRPEGFSAYIAVTAAYWAFMLTDGALRMLVLLHFHELGFSPVTLAWLFLLYEIAGIVTNLSAGWIAARFGLTTTLYVGLFLQIIALLALSRLDPGWAMALSVPFVMVVQGLSGVAKDLAKMSSKSAVKLLAPEGNGGLFRWVAILTGSKNAVKGFGFFLGAALLGLAGFHASVLGMALILGVILAGVVVFMPSGLPKGSKSAKFAHVFATDARINRLSLARMFLFGARDTWFVVGIPIYFHAVLSDGTPEGARQAFFLVGSFMALWIIGYGVMQGFAPGLLRAAQRSTAEITRAAVLWVGLLTVIPAVLALIVWSGVPGLTPVLVAGLLVFGFVFAINSSLHSY